jgi:sterol desaturase/sphingolipid hydroxylase (fatty acid hydroxylase superfamily)
MRLLRVGYPVVMLALLGAAVALVGAGHALGWLVLLLAVAIAASFGVERLIPYEPGWNVSRDDVRRDWLHFAVNELALVGGIAALPLIASPGLWPARWPLAAELALAIVVFDAGATLAHRASHRVPLLWRFHAVHHAVTRFYGFNGLMKHPVHLAIELGAGMLPLFALGIPREVAALLALAAAIQLLMQHSNADYTLGPLRWVLVSNTAHRFHHLKGAGAGDVNFGFFTNLWDFVLGTWRHDPARRFTSDDLGISDRDAVPTRYLAQLAAPFRRTNQETP